MKKKKGKKKEERGGNRRCPSKRVNGKHDWKTEFSGRVTGDLRLKTAGFGMCLRRKKDQGEIRSHPNIQAKTPLLSLAGFPSYTRKPARERSDTGQRKN